MISVLVLIVILAEKTNKTAEKGSGRVSKRENRTE